MVCGVDVTAASVTRELMMTRIGRGGGGVHVGRSGMSCSALPKFLLRLQIGYFRLKTCSARHRHCHYDHSHSNIHWSIARCKFRRSKSHLKKAARLSSQGTLTDTLRCTFVSGETEFCSTLLRSFQQMLSLSEHCLAKSYLC